MAASTKYDIRLINEDDYSEVLSLLMTSFFPDEPISRCLRMTEPKIFANDILRACLADKCSFLTYDTETKQIVGVCLNLLKYKDKKEPIEAAGEKSHYLLHIIDAIDGKVNIYDLLKTDPLLHIFIISVHKVARGHNLASRLIEKSMEYVAKELNTHGAYAEATNVYSLNCFKRQNFQIFDELIYTDFDSNRLAELKDKMYDRCYLVGRNF